MWILGVKGGSRSLRPEAVVTFQVKNGAGNRQREKQIKNACRGQQREEVAEESHLGAQGWTAVWHAADELIRHPRHPLLRRLPVLLQPNPREQLAARMLCM